jgi:hypothetical protein
MLIYLHIVYGCLCATMAELSGCDRDNVMVSLDCQLDQIEKQLGDWRSTPLGVFSVRWTKGGRSRRKTYSECGWHYLIDLGPRWNKSGKRSRVPAAHIYNSSYSGGRDQEDCRSKPAWANSSSDPILKKLITKKGWRSGSRCRLWVQAPVPKKKKWKKEKVSKCRSSLSLSLSLLGHHEVSSAPPCPPQYDGWKPQTTSKINLPSLKLFTSDTLWHQHR